MLAPGTATRLMQSTDSSTGVVSGLGGGVSGASGLLSNSAFTWTEQRKTRVLSAQKQRNGVSRAAIGRQQLYGHWTL